VSAISRLLASLVVTSAALLSGGPPESAHAVEASDLRVYFAPLPPLPPGSDLPFRDGAPDYLDLFRPNAKWDATARNIDVFVIYSTWVRHYASWGNLASLIEGLRARGIALGMELGPLPDPKPGECSGGESFGGIYEIDMLRRIRDLGGRVDVVVFDEPFAFGHQLDAPGHCHWPVERIARHLAEFEAMARKIFPDLIFGGNEPMWASPSVTPEDVVSWVEAYKAATGRPLSFIHLDLDWNRPDWLENAVAVRSALAGRGVRVGYIYNGGENAEQNAWIAAATDRAVRLEAASPVAPDDVVFASWFDQPDRTLPDSDPTTFTGLVRHYFDPHAIITLDPDGRSPAGIVHTPEGAPIPDATVHASATPNAGAPGISAVSGIVPAGASKAVIVFRANGEGTTDRANVDLKIDSVSYREGKKNLAPNPDFRRDTDWGGYGAGSARISRGLLRLRARPNQALLVDSIPFKVTPGAAFAFEVAATVPVAATGAVYAGVVFLAPKEIARSGLVLAPASVQLAPVKTSAKGAFRIKLSGALAGPGRLRLDVDPPGYWPGHAEIDRGS
jgi:hypothetical protein